MIIPTIAKSLSEGLISKTGLLLNGSGSTTTPRNSSPFLSLPNLTQLISGRMPGQVIIQFTDQCNASCAQCGMRRENEYSRSTLDVDRVKKLLDAAAQKGMAAVSFTGGEPLLYLDKVVECVRYARSLGIRYVRTGTNGFMFRGHQRPDFETRMHQLEETLMDSGLYTFWISIDSASARIHEKNRGLPGSYEGIAKALPIFHEHGLFPSANLGINRYLGGEDAPPKLAASEIAPDLHQYFAEGFRCFYNPIEELGFTIVNACYPMDMDDETDEAVFTATSEDNLSALPLKKNGTCLRRCTTSFPNFAADF